LAGALHLLTPRLFTLPLTVYGTPEQRARWLGRFAGERFVAATAAIVEPRWDFDATRLAPRAERDGAGWVLPGKKGWVPLGDRAEAMLVYASTTDGGGAFIVAKGAPGLSIGAREKNMGLRALDTFAVTLDRVRVPAANRLGGPAAKVVDGLVDAARVE